MQVTEEKPMEADRPMYMGAPRGSHKQALCVRRLGSRSTDKRQAVRFSRTGGGL